MDRLVSALRDDLDSAVDPRLIVLEGLVQAGRPEALSGSERAQLADGRRALEAAIEKHPGLRLEMQAVRREASLFDEAWREAGRLARPPRPPRRRAMMRWPARIGLGAAAVVLVAVMYLALAGRIAQETVTAPATAHQTVVLDDGTQVRLAPGSSLTYVPGSDFNRTVELVGSAFFDVTGQPGRFAVETSAAVTSVLGTRFGVESNPHETRVTLVSGSVAVAPSAGSPAVVVLEPGQQTVVSRGESPSRPVSVDLARSLAWSDLLVFRQTRMDSVVVLLKEVRDVDVTLDTALAPMEVTGTFSPEQTTREILDILSATLNARVVETEDGFHLSPI